MDRVAEELIIITEFTVRGTVHSEYRWGGTLRGGQRTRHRMIMNDVEIVGSQHVVDTRRVEQSGHLLTEAQVLQVVGGTYELGLGAGSMAGTEQRHVVASLHESVHQGGADQLQAAVATGRDLVPGGGDHGDPQGVTG